MFVRARSIDADSVQEHDVVIIGAGAAGIAIAREFLNQPSISVAMCEAGGLSFSDRSQEFYLGETSGSILEKNDAYLPSTRLRYFGGTTNHWHGWCGRLDPIDFEERPWLPVSGWPITLSDLEPYYQRALPIVEIDGIDTPLHKLATLDRPELLSESESVETKIFHRSPPTRFGQRYRAELKQSSNISVYLGAPIRSLEVDDSGKTIGHCLVAKGSDSSWKIRGKHYVLATGGLENPRMLLASQKRAPQGIGNEHDLVGRFFMDHLQILDIGQLILDSAHLNNHLYERFVHPILHHFVVATTCLSQAQQRQHHLQNCALFYLQPEQPVGPISTALRRALPKIDNPLSDISDSSPFFGRLECRTEQRPNRESRVTLTNELDDIGMPRLKLDWRLSKEDRESAYRTLELIAHEFGAQGEGRVRVVFDQNGPWDRRRTFGGAHHIGTTRMDTRPEHGVVNKDCRVHSMDNLFIAGSSVFPTSGVMNPTLTIVALALRLSDHLKGRLAQ